MMRLTACVVLSILLSLGLNQRSAAAQTAPTTHDPTPVLRVATRALPPFVLRRNGDLTGFSIDLWRQIAKDLDLQFEFLIQPALANLLGDVKSGTADAAIGGVSITAERELQYDFSQPIFESGLQIMVPTGTAQPNMFGAIEALFGSQELLALLGVLLILVLVPAHIIWLVERRSPEGLVSDRAYYPGILKAAWWAAGTIGGQADEMPRSPIGRLVAILWMFVSVLFIASFTAAMTASVTVQQLKGDISGPADLPGKRIATVAGTTSATYLRNVGADVAEFPDTAEAFQALGQNGINAVVFDAPVLLYYVTHEGSGKVRAVGPIFHKEDYGILFPSNSPYRKRVNAALLRLRERGDYAALVRKWFGEDAARSE